MARFEQLARRAALFLGVCAAALAEQITYHLEPVKPLSRFTSDQRVLLMKLNRADNAHLARLGHIIVPDRWERDELVYSPMPQSVPQLSDESKAIVVDLTAQVFGAYESGNLVRWGPVSSGRRHHETPPGTYHLNWRARLHVSTEDPTWIMPWYFNFASDRGLGLHQYSLPGRPASHGCVRMLAVDAKWVFSWGEGWTVADAGGEVVELGTLVLVVGKYNHRAPQPWLEPGWWAQGASLSLPETAAAE